MNQIDKAQRVSLVVNRIKTLEDKLEFIRSDRRYQDEFIIGHPRSEKLSEYTSCVDISEDDVSHLRKFWQNELDNYRTELGILMDGGLG